MEKRCLWMAGTVVLRRQVRQFIDQTGTPCDEECLTTLGALIVKK